MDIKQIQLKNDKQSKIIKFIISLISYFVKPLVFKIWFFLSLSLTFGVEPITYLQSLVLMTGIYLINKFI